MADTTYELILRALRAHANTDLTPRQRRTEIAVVTQLLADQMTDDAPTGLVVYPSVGGIAFALVKTHLVAESNAQGGGRLFCGRKFKLNDPAKILTVNPNRATCKTCLKRWNNATDIARRSHQVGVRMGRIAIDDGVE